jgi:membrane protease subunit HflK
MYLETMQDILTHSPSLVVDDKLKGLVPFLPLSPPNPASPIPAIPPAPNTAAQQGAPR